MEQVLYVTQVPGKKRAGKFDREELVLLPCLAFPRQGICLPTVKPGCVRFELDAMSTAFNMPTTAQVEAKLHAIGVETCGPIELTFGKEIVPFDAEARPVEPGE